jgi:hypothetical protein
MQFAALWFIQTRLLVPFCVLTLQEQDTGKITNLWQQCGHMHEGALAKLKVSLKVSACP